MKNKEQIIQDIRETLKESPLDFEPIHADLTLKWVLKLKPDADDALQIASYGHDIDRAINKITEGKHLKDYAMINEFKKEHEVRSAQIMQELLEKGGYNNEFINKVTRIVGNHEFGGDEETNILMDADSIAYFDYNIDEYYRRNGSEKTKKKVGFMFDRSSDRAREIIKSLDYKNPAIKEIVEGV